MTDSFTLEQTFDQETAKPSRADKRVAIDVALLANPNRSDRDIAQAVGCDHKTVGTRRREIGNSSEIPHTGSVADATTKNTVVPTEEKWDPFDPNGEDLVIPPQGAVAVYENPRGHVVIRQEEGPGDDGDHFVIVEPKNLHLLLARLQQHLP